MSYTRPAHNSADASWEGAPTYTRPDFDAVNVYFFAPGVQAEFAVTLLGDTALLEGHLINHAELSATGEAIAAFSAVQIAKGPLDATLDDVTALLEGGSSLRLWFTPALQDATASFTANRGVAGSLEDASPATLVLHGHHTHDPILRAFLPDDTATFEAEFSQWAYLEIPVSTLRYSRLAPRLFIGHYAEIPTSYLTLEPFSPAASGSVPVPSTDFAFEPRAPANVFEYRVSRVKPHTILVSLVLLTPRVMGTIIQPPPQEIPEITPLRGHPRAPCIIGQIRASGGPAMDQVGCSSSTDTTFSRDQFASDRRNYITRAVFPIDLKHPGGFFITEGKGDQVVTTDTQLHWGVFWLTGMIHQESDDEDVNESINMPGNSSGFPEWTNTKYGNKFKSTFTSRFTFDGFAGVGWWNSPVWHHYSVNYMAEIPPTLDDAINNGDALFYISTTFLVSERLDYWKDALVEGGLLGSLGYPAWRPGIGLEVWVTCYAEDETSIGTFPLGDLKGSVDQNEDAIRTNWTIYKQFRPYPGTRYVRFKWYTYTHGNHKDIIDRGHVWHQLEGFELFADIYPWADRRNVLDLANPNFDHHTFAGWDVPRYADHHRVPDRVAKTDLDPWGGTEAPQNGTLIQRLPIPGYLHPRVDTCDIAATFFVHVYTLGRYTIQELSDDPAFVRFVCARAENEIDHFVENFVNWDFDTGEDFPTWVEDTAPSNETLFNQASFVLAKWYNPSTAGQVGWEVSGAPARSRWVTQTDSPWRGVPARYRARYPIRQSNGAYTDTRLRVGESGSMVFQVDVRIPRRSRWIQLELNFPKFGLIRVSPLYLVNIKNIPPVDVVLAPPLRFNTVRPLVNYLIIKAEVPFVSVSFTSFTTELFAWYFGGASDRAYIVDEVFVRSVQLALETLQIDATAFADVAYALREAFQVQSDGAAAVETASFLHEHAGITALPLFGVAPWLSEQGQFHDALAFQLGVRARSILRGSVSASAAWSSVAMVSERYGLSSGCAFALSALATDGLDLHAEVSALAPRMVVLAEAITAADVGASSTQVYDDLVEAMVVADALRSTFFGDATEQIDIQMLAQVRQRLKAAGHDALAMQSATQGSVLLNAPASDQFAATDSLAASLRATIDARESVALLGRIPLGDGEYSMWVL